MKKILFSTFITIIGITNTVQAKNISCRTSQPDWMPDLNRVYKVNEFHIYYSDLAESKHKLPQVADSNHNKIPDYVENIAIQASNSRDMFKLAGFRSPLHSPRYVNNAEAIAIFLLNINGNGTAFESPAIHTNISPNLKTMPCSLNIHISHNLEGFPGSWATVTHELFHLYQYGYAQFKNSWYLESLANWADRAVKIDITANTQKLPILPQNSTELENQIFKQSYTPLWRRLFLISQQDVLIVPKSMQDRTYIGGSKVFLDHEWRGTKFVLRFMQNLEKESDKISKQRQWPQYHWKEKDQRLTEWDPIIFGLIQKQLQQPAYDQKEIQFMRKVAIEDLKGK